MRIVSLLPSATEMVCALGLREQLVGVTHECDFPESVLSIPRVTRTLIPGNATSAQIDAMVSERARTRRPLYELEMETLSALNPDLIVTQGLCDVCAVDEKQVCDAARSMHRAPQIINLEPMSLDGVFDSMEQVARAAGVVDRGETAVLELKRRVSDVEARSRSLRERPTVVFLEWLDPFFCAGHWNPELVALAGGRELLGKAGSPSRRVGWAELQHADPDVIFVACCGYSAERAAVEVDVLNQSSQRNELRAVKNGRVFVADGSAYFNRPGPRLVDSLEILSRSLDELSRSRIVSPA